MKTTGTVRGHGRRAVAKRLLRARRRSSAIFDAVHGDRNGHRFASLLILPGFASVHCNSHSTSTSAPFHHSAGVAHMELLSRNPFFKLFCRSICWWSSTRPPTATQHLSPAGAGECETK